MNTLNNEFKEDLIDFNSNVQDKNIENDCAII